MAKKGLGRGFSSLIPTEMIIDEKIDSELGLEYDKSQLKELKISDISPDPEQPRRHFNKDNAIPFCHLNDFFMTGVCCNANFNSGHYIFLPLLQYCQTD